MIEFEEQASRGKSICESAIMTSTLRLYQSSNANTDQGPALSDTNVMMVACALMLVMTM